MDLTYKIIGGDGQEYGPVRLAELKSWIGTGRVRGDTQVSRSDLGTWAAAEQFAELQVAAPAFPPTAVSAAPATAGLELERQLKSGASWFYWIAALSAINTIAGLSGSSWRFMFGLGITQIIEVVARKAATLGTLIAVVLDLLVLGMFVLFGYCAARRHNWSFILGMAIFALDGLIFLAARDWLGAGVHAFVLYCVFKGYQANRALQALNASHRPMTRP